MRVKETRPLLSETVAIKITVHEKEVLAAIRLQFPMSTESALCGPLLLLGILSYLRTTPPARNLDRAWLLQSIKASLSGEKH